MEIFQVAGTITCTSRHEGMDHLPLRLLRNAKGKYVVAVDQVGSRTGNWVFTSSGSAARLALDDKKKLTDLTVAGIIDNWEQ